MRWRVALGALTVAVALALATANGLAAATATKVVYVAPVDPSGKALSSDIVLISTKGSCEPGSDSVPGPLYRCFNDDNTVLDPCWAVTSGLLGPSPQHRSVLCMPWPWSRIVGRLDSKTALPASTQPIPPGTSFPWGVHLANGDNCLAAQGAHDEYRGRVVDYYCGSALHLVLLRGMRQTTEPWTFDSAIWTGKSYSPGPTEAVRVAWYGRYAGPR